MTSPETLAALAGRLSSWFGPRRRAAARHLARDRSPQAIRALAHALAGTRDERLRAIALDALDAVDDEETVDAVCSAWAATRSRRLADIIHRHKWVAARPPELRVLTALELNDLDAVTAGGAEVVNPLLRACEDRDPQIARHAHLALRTLTEPAARDALCARVIDRDDPLPRQVCLDAGYLPSDPGRRALYHFLTEQWADYEAVDFDHRLLRTAHRTADDSLRARIREAARRGGRSEWVQVALADHREELSSDDWELTIALLNDRRDWHRMWALAQDAPAKWSARLLNRLAEENWAADNKDDEDGYLQLVRLAERCSDDVPDIDVLIRCRRSLAGSDSRIYALALGPKNNLAVTGGQDHAVRLWQLRGEQPVQKLDGHTGSVWALAIAPDGRLLASAGNDRSVRLWRLPDGQPLGVLTGHDAPVYALAFTPDGRRLASGGADGTVQLWDTARLRRVKTLTGHNSWVGCLAVSPDGELLASGDRDAVVRLWRLPAGRAARELRGHTDWVRSLTFSPNGELLASGGADRSVRLWRAPGGERVKVLQGHRGIVMSLAFSPDGRLLASGSADQSIRLWRLPAGQPGPVLEGHQDWVGCLAVSPDGRLLVSGSADRTARLWNLRFPAFDSLPVAQTCLDDIYWVEQVLQKRTLQPNQQGWLEFLLALMRWRRRFDIEVEHTQARWIGAGGFDIEIEIQDETAGRE